MSEQTLDRLFKELEDKISLRGKNVKTDYREFAGRMGHRAKAKKYGLNKTRHPFKGAA